MPKIQALSILESARRVAEYAAAAAVLVAKSALRRMKQLRLPQVVKQDGNRSEFNRNKLLTGFMRALHKRPVPTEYVDAAIDRIVQKILSLGEREIESRKIGEMVMKELYKLDKVAYIRFSSVYKSFQDADDFHDAIKEAKNPIRKRQKRPPEQKKLI